MTAPPNDTRLANTAYLLARLVARSVQLGMISRPLHLDMLRETLRRQPWCFGVWSVWLPGEPGVDAPHAGKPGHDAAGRFMPYWHTRERTPTLETNVGADQAGIGDYFQLPFQARRPVPIGPYEYAVAGQPCILFSATAPILTPDGCHGVVGVDLRLDPADAAASIRHIEGAAGGGVVLLDGDGKSQACGASGWDLLKPDFPGPWKSGMPLPPELSERLHPARESDGHGQADGLMVGSVLRHGLPVEMRLLRCRHHPLQVLWFRPAPAPPAGFSARESEIMHWLAEGKSNEEIALILVLSPHTVKNHLHRIFRRLGVSSRHAALVAWQDLRVV